MADALSLFVDRLSTPVGELMIAADAEGRLRAVHWTNHEAQLLRSLQRHGNAAGFALRDCRNPSGLTAAIAGYFAGDLHAIDALPVLTGGTPFQRTVWVALRHIPCGSTISYGTLAARIGRPSAVRAVGLANGANPVGIVVPCHRVIGSDGTLTGYGGGMDRKRWLLAHEGAGSLSLLPDMPRRGNLPAGA